MDTEKYTYSYDVAISFAGEQRDYALKLAQGLAKVGLRVFYDQWSTGELWGPDATKVLPIKYKELSMYVIPIFSKQYNSKFWTRFEFEHLQSRQYKEDEYILPIITDGAFPEGWPLTRLYIKSSDYSIDEIALLVRDKVAKKKSEQPKEHNKNLMYTTLPNGQCEEVEVIFAYKDNNTGYEYVIYTKNEIDVHGRETIYISKVIRDHENKKVTLIGVPDEEWPRVRGIIRENGEDPGAGIIHGALYDSEGYEIL